MHCSVLHVMLQVHTTYGNYQSYKDSEVFQWCAIAQVHGYSHTVGSCAFKFRILSNLQTHGL